MRVALLARGAVEAPVPGGDERGGDERGGDERGCDERGGDERGQLVACHLAITLGVTYAGEASGHVGGSKAAVNDAVR
jgi:hypothetical protein